MVCCSKISYDGLRKGYRREASPAEVNKSQSVKLLLAAAGDAQDVAEQLYTLHESLTEYGKG